jgi:hypothetical protein
MQSQPLVTVKRAAALLGLDKDELRKKLTTGEVKGEQREVGEKKKWFIYSGELEQLLTARFGEPEETAARVSLDGMSAFFQKPQAEEIEDATIVFPAAEPTEPVEMGAPVHTEKAPAARTSARTRSRAVESPTQVATSIDYSASLELALRTSNVIDASIVRRPDTHELDTIINSLSIEFTYRLAEEQQRVYRLQTNLEEKAQLADRVAPLETALQREVREGCMKSIHIKNLEHEVQALKTALEYKNLPWWKRLFGRAKESSNLPALRSHWHSDQA